MFLLQVNGRLYQHIVFQASGRFSAAAEPLFALHDLLIKAPVHP